MPNSKPKPKAKAAARMQDNQPKKKTGVVAVRKRAVKNPLGQASYIHALDARCLTHVPPSIPMGPYTVMRGRSVITVSSSTAAATNTVLLLGPHRVASVDMAITPLIGISGTGVNVPGTTETNINDSIVSNYAGTLQSSTACAQLHAFTVTVQCTSTATTASGVVYTGALCQRVGRSNYATWNGVANALLARREMLPTSAYNTMTQPVVLSAYPVDMTEWSMQHPVLSVATVLSDNYSADTLSQIAIVIPNTVAAVEYTISVHTEWRINFTDVVLASTSTKKDPPPQGWWNSAISALGDLNGRIDTALHIGSAVGAIGQKFQGMKATLGQLGALTKLL